MWLITVTAGKLQPDKPGLAGGKLAYLWLLLMHELWRQRQPAGKNLFYASKWSTGKASAVYSAIFVIRSFTCNLFDQNTPLLSNDHKWIKVLFAHIIVFSQHLPAGDYRIMLNHSILDPFRTLSEEYTFKKSWSSSQKNEWNIIAD